MTAVIVLAAGSSSRLGRPKQLVRLRGETLLDRAVRVAHEAECSPVVAVLGCNADQVRQQCTLTGASVIENPEWATGMASSIRIALNEIRRASGVILMACDQPAVTASHLAALCSTRETTASGYSGRRGVPAYFPASVFASLMALQGDSGARELLRGALVVPLQGGDLDVDTDEDLRIAERLFT